MKRIALILTILLIVLMTGCKSKRSVVTTPDITTPSTVVIPTDTVTVERPETPIVTPEPGDVKEREEVEKQPVEREPSREELLYGNMINANGEWQTMVAKGSVSLGSLSSSFEMRMINNQSLQISLRPIFGIEIARVVVTGDSIYLYDKINKRYIAEGMDLLGDKIPFVPTISDMQNAMLGRPFILGQTSIGMDNFNDFIYETADNQWAMQPRNLPEDIIYMFGLENETLICAVAQQATTQRELRCDYQEHEVFSNRVVPTSMLLSAKGGKKSYSLKITYSSIEWDRNTSVQKLSTKGMKKTTISNVVGSLLK